MSSKVEFAQTKQDVEIFTGGCDIDLDKKLKSGKTVKEEIEYELKRVLPQELKNREPLIENIKRWQKQFRGEKDSKNYPYYGCSNMAVPLTRWLIETVLVRLFDVVFGQKKIWSVRALTEDFIGIDKQLEDGLDWWAKWIVNFKKMIFSPLLQACKMGTGFIKLDYQRRNRMIYKYANEVETESEDIKIYKTKEGQKIVKVPITTYEGPVILPISIEDFVMSSDAVDLKDAFLVGFRTFIRKPQLELRIDHKIYRDEIRDKIATLTGDNVDETKKERAESQGLIIDELRQNKIAVWELWFKHDVDDDGEEDDIVVSWHEGTGTILRAIYNPHFYGFRPFKKFVLNPVEYSPYGEGMCSILEQLQNEIDSMHNQRLDRLNQINNPMYLMREGAGPKDFKRFPGKIIYVDDIDTSMKEMQQSDTYPSSMAEEMLLNTYAERAIGVTPQVMGQSTAERPVARETLALIQEANKKFKFIIDNCRDELTDTAMLVLELFAQYAPRWEYKSEENIFVEESERKMMVTKTVDFPQEYLRDGIKIDLKASSELMNQEVKREIDLTVYQIVSDYYTKMAGMVQAVTSPMVPPDFKQFVFKISKIGGKMLKRILEDFDIVDAEELVEDMDESFDVKKAISKQPPKPPMGPMGPSGGPGGPGGPGGGGSPGGASGAPGAPPMIPRI